MALSGTALQSSTAVGGTSKPELYTSKSCTRTSQEEKPWWRLQLPAVYRVSEIKFIRDDPSYGLKGVEILIGNSLENNGNDNPR